MKYRINPPFLALIKPIYDQLKVKIEEIEAKLIDDIKDLADEDDITTKLIGFLGEVKIVRRKGIKNYKYSLYLGAHKVHIKDEAKTGRDFGLIIYFEITEPFKFKGKKIFSLQAKIAFNGVVNNNNYCFKVNDNILTQISAMNSFNPDSWIILYPEKGSINQEIKLIEANLLSMFIRQTKKRIQKKVNNGKATGKIEICIPSIIWKNLPSLSDFIIKDSLGTNSGLYINPENREVFNHLIIGRKYSKILVIHISNKSLNTDEIKELVFGEVPISEFYEFN